MFEISIETFRGFIDGGFVEYMYYIYPCRDVMYDEMGFGLGFFDGFDELLVEYFIVEICFGIWMPFAVFMR